MSATRTPGAAFIETITSAEPALRDRPFDELVRGLSAQDLLAACEELEAFRRSAESLYNRVRAALFLYAAYRFHLMDRKGIPSAGVIPPAAYEDLLSRRFEQAIGRFREAMAQTGPNGAILSALADSYHHLAFQNLLDQVRRSVRASLGNQWMFRVGNAQDHPVKVRRELLNRGEGTLLYPVLCEETPVRLDLSHSGWSDIFFLGMDYPEGARVTNISVDLGVHGRDTSTRPPVQAFVRVIPEPLLRLTSIDLQSTKDITDLRDLFNFGNDYLSLLKAGVIASGVIPPSFEGTGQSVASILEQLVGPGMGLELVTQVNDIPKGSRLAVSTNLLACMIAVLMRATGQTGQFEGSLNEQERRLVASRAILGEWLGGSGGGWQDSGGIWPGFKVICGALAGEGDPEFGVSRGRLLPTHKLLGGEELHPQIMERVTESLVLVHGGMAQNVGPILEMVTEKYLLRLSNEWKARLSMRSIFDSILGDLKTGNMKGLGEDTTRNFTGPLRTIIPAVTNRFTETIIEKARATAGTDWWGFLMLGGMSGGGMAMFVAPERRERFLGEILNIMRDTKRELEDALPFAMDPVVYDFAVNTRGTEARLRCGRDAVLPASYYALLIPDLAKRPAESISYLRRAELDHYTSGCVDGDQSFGLLRSIVTVLFRVADPASQSERLAWDEESEQIKQQNGFDRVQHEQVRADMLSGRIGLSRNRLPVNTDIEDVRDSDVDVLDRSRSDVSVGKQHLRAGRVAVVSLAGGVGTRWTTGAGVVKAVNPFVEMEGKHRSFLEVHLAKSQRVAEEFATELPHVVSTSFLTHGPIARHLALNTNYGFKGSLYLSSGRSIGQRLVPMVRDLAFLWEEMPQEQLDEQKQKVREHVRRALIDWARSKGEGSDYTDNVPIQRFNPPGHWYEIPNMLLNGVLAQLLREHPAVDTLMVHNIDTLGADADAAALGQHLGSGNMLTFEVVPRHVNDRGGGLARVNGRPRLLEGLAQPREDDELRLRFYNTMTTWVNVDALLDIFGLTRQDLEGPAERISEAVRRLAQRVPTYVTIKNVKRRWGHGQEDVYPVAQFEKLWSDMTALSELKCGYLVVPRSRGQQLKDPAELDQWVMDGSKAHVASLCRLS